MHKRPRLTDGFHRPSDDDNSSSGCSSAGPSGLRNLIPSPVSTNGPRSSLSGSFLGRPSPVDDHHKLSTNKMMSSSSSRYLPYTIRPLVVRAKRKLQSDDNVQVTSTAQRIINALENISTPVVNSVKIPFEPTIVSRPVFTPLRRDTQGPPILKSPLVPSPQGKIVYGPSLHIPKMVDFGTNTDLSMQTSNLEQQLSYPATDIPASRSDGGGKMKVMTSRVHAPPVRPSFSTAVPALTTAGPRRGAVPSKYKFSKPWSIRDLQKVITGREGGKSVDAVDNKLKRDAKQDLKPESMDTSKSVEKKQDSGPLKPLSALVQPASGKGWDCPTCMVPNKADAAACVCCGEKNPSGPPPASAVKAALKDWECPTCMVKNKADAAACVCCSEKNPNGPPAGAAGAATPAPKPSFSFGFGAATTPKAASDTFSFGPPKDTSTPKSTFSFGIKCDATSTAAVSSTTTSFTFGIKTAADSSKSKADSTSATICEPSKPFTFGTPGTTPVAKTPSTSITFGLPAEPSAATAVKSSPAFPSGTKAAPEAAVSPKDASTADKTGTPSKSTSVFGSFSFGTTVGTPTSKPPTDVIKEEMWSCENCPAKNRMSVTHCVGCAAAKPKPESKSPPGAKKFHFEPFFGGRGENRPSEPMSPPEGELKRKIPSGSSSSSAASSLGFTYTPPSEPTLKLKAPEPAPAPAGEMKSGSFLDALKNKSQFTFSSPAPGASLIPTSPASSTSASASTTGASSALASIAPTSTTSAISGGPTSLASAVSPLSAPAPAAAGPPAGLFQFGGTPTSNAASKALTTPIFGATANNNALNQSTFSFGGGANTLVKNGPLPVSSTPAPSGTPSVFGAPPAGGSSTSFGFGVTASSASSSTPAQPSLSSGAPTGFGFGASTPAPAPAQPNAGFSLTPNFNFGAAPGAPAAPSTPFIFQAPPSASPQPGGDMGGRKIRKATRRIR